MIDWTATQGHRDYLAFVALLYRVGCIYPEFVTDKPQYQRALQQLVTGKFGIFLDELYTGSYGEIDGKDVNDYVSPGDIYCNIVVVILQ
jgi:hypothetical protein